MRSIHRNVITAVLIIALAVPAMAGQRPSPRTGNMLEAFKRFVIRAMTRISPPVGCPTTSTDEVVLTTTDAPTKTQSGQ